MQNKQYFIIFDNHFIVQKTDLSSIKTATDLRDSFCELLGLEDTILDLKSQQSFEIPMLLRDNKYYDIQIELLSHESKLYKLSIITHSKHTISYTNALKEINKQALIQEIKDEDKKNNPAVLYDTLTGLPNRKYLLDKMDILSKNHTVFTLCLLDIDDFNMINSEYGAHAGDMVLKHLSEILQNSVAENLFVARVFADTFALLLSFKKDEGFMQNFVAGLQKSIKETPLIYTKEDIIALEVTICYDYSSIHYTNNKVFLEHLENIMEKRKIDKRLSR